MEMEYANSFLNVRNKYLAVGVATVTIALWSLRVSDVFD